MASNANLGKLILCIAFLIFLYYFFWIAILPFMRVEEGKKENKFFVENRGKTFVTFVYFNSFADNWILQCFPPLTYAFVFPVSFGTLFVGSIMCFTMYHAKRFILFF